MENINNNPQEIQDDKSESSPSQGAAEGTFIEHVSVDRDLNECGELWIGMEDWWSNGKARDETKMCDKNVQEEEHDKTSQWESHNYAWGWLAPSHPSDPRMTV